MPNGKEKAAKKSPKRRHKRKDPGQTPILKYYTRAHSQTMQNEAGKHDNPEEINTALDGINTALDGINTPCRPHHHHQMKRI